MAYKGRRPFTDLEVRTILKAFDQEEFKFSKRDKAWFAYGLATGFRFNELSHIKITAISYNWKVHNYASVEGKWTKNGESATQLVTGKMPGGQSPVDIMQEWLDQLRELKTSEKSFVFLSQIGRNKPITRQWANRRLTELCSQNGIYGPIGTHSLRKTFTYKMDLYRREQFRRGELKEDPNRVLMKDGRWKDMETMDNYRDFIYTNWEAEALDFTS